MRQVLFRIPLDAVLTLGDAKLPWFGFGLLLAVWGAVGVSGFLIRRRRSQGTLTPDDLHAGIVWTVVALLIMAAPLIQRRLGIAGVPIFGYGFLLFLGFITAVSLASRRAAQQGLSSEIIWDLAPWLLIPGVLGGRIYHCVQYRQEVFRDCRTLADVLATFVNLSRGGLVLYGGLIGGAVGWYLFCRFRKLDRLAIADLVTPSIFVGIGFGRIGCLMNGCCFGDLCQLPWAIQFPFESVPFMAMVARGIIPPDAPASPWLHPTQIYSALDGFVIAGIILLFYPHRRSNGEAFALGLMIYAVTRFLIEFLRGDEGGQLGTMYTTAQFVSFAMFTTGIILLWDRERRPAYRGFELLPRS